MDHLKSAAQIKLELGQNLRPLTPAGKLQLIMELIGNQPIYDEEGEEIGRTISIISNEEAIKLLNGDIK